MNQLKIVDTRFEALNLVAGGNALLFQQVDEGSFFDAKTFCNVTVMDRDMPRVGAHLIFRKKHPLLPKINEIIIRNRNKFNGIAMKYYRRAMQYDQCPRDGGYKALCRFL